MHTAIALAAAGAAADLRPRGAAAGPAAGGFPGDASDDPAPASCLDGFAPVPLHRRRLRPRETLYHAGQPRTGLAMVEAGCFKTCLLAEDGREKITGFRFAGDFLGLDALGRACHPCDAVCIEGGTVVELTPAQVRDAPGELGTRIVLALAREVRHTGQWMLTLSTLRADRRVASFLLELDARRGGPGRGDDALPLPMTRADVGNYLALQLETVVRALTRLDLLGLVRVERRRILLLDRVALARYAHRDAATVH